MAEDRTTWLPRVDAHLATMSWDSTWAHMKTLLDAAAMQREDERNGVTPVLPGSEDMTTI
jgi:hypothetical protein